MLVFLSFSRKTEFYAVYPPQSSKGSKQLHAVQPWFSYTGFVISADKLKTQQNSHWSIFGPRAHKFYSVCPNSFQECDDIARWKCSLYTGSDKAKCKTVFLKSVSPCNHSVSEAVLVLCWHWLRPSQEYYFTSTTTSCTNLCLHEHKVYYQYVTLLVES